MCAWLKGQGCARAQGWTTSAITRPNAPPGYNTTFAAEPLWDRYVFSFYWAITTLTTVCARMRMSSSRLLAPAIGSTANYRNLPRPLLQLQGSVGPSVDGREGAPFPERSLRRPKGWIHARLWIAGPWRLRMQAGTPVRYGTGLLAFGQCHELAQTYA